MGHVLKYMSNGRLTRRRKVNELSLIEGRILSNHVQVEIKTSTLPPNSRVMTLFLRGQPLHPRDTSEAAVSGGYPTPVGIHGDTVGLA